MNVLQWTIPLLLLLACQKPVSITGHAAIDSCSLLPVHQWSPDGIQATEVYCETSPYSSLEDKRVVLYFDSVPSDWMLSGEQIAPTDIASGKVYLPGTCRLLLGDSDAQASLKEILQRKGIPLPPNDAEYMLINSTSEILETYSFVHNYVEVLRAGSHVWLSTSTCGLS